MCESHCSVNSEHLPNNFFILRLANFKMHFYDVFIKYKSSAYVHLISIRVITKLPNTEQSSKGKGKTHKSTNRLNQSTTGKLGKPQWPWLDTGISKEMGD